MRLIFSAALYFSLFASSAQTVPRSTFAIKGQEWYYQNYYPKFGLGGKINGYFEVTSFDYKVNTVKDSAGSTYSYITKTGTAANMDDAQWHRDFLIRSDSQSLYLPPDFYLIDTIFICDQYDKMKKKHVWISLHVEGDSILYPLAMDSAADLPLSSLSYKNKMTDPYAASQKRFLGMNAVNSDYHKGKITETYRKILGIKKIRTSAGEFTCLHIQEHYEYANSRMAITIDEYYCPGVGLIRMEQEHGYYMVLSRIKKKG